MKSLSLTELNTHISRVVALNFPKPIWVRAEILQIKTTRGHTYLELVEKDKVTDQVSAQAQAVLWARTRIQIIRQLQLAEIDGFLQVGSEVAILVEVSHHSVYGLKLSIQNIDPSYTLGKLALIKQQTIARITKERLLDLNSRVKLPPVLQNIAVIGSYQSSGYQDFKQHLLNNDFKYAFHFKLYQNAMQGAKVLDELLANLAQISRQAQRFDCVVIIRGGGSRFDLSAFDQYEIARAVAQFPIPVFTGIGHETDRTIADMVSHRSFKTPTAVAGYIIDNNATFEHQILEYKKKIIDTGYALINTQLRNLDLLSHRTDHLGTILIQRASNDLVNLQWQLRHAMVNMIEAETSLLTRISAQISLLQPSAVFRRGYSLTMKDGMAIRDASQLQEDDLITTYYEAGVSESMVTRT